MDIFGTPWISMDLIIFGFPYRWIPMDSHGDPWILIIQGYQWIIRGYPGLSMNIHEQSIDFPWISWT